MARAEPATARLPVRPPRPVSATRRARLGWIGFVFGTTFGAPTAFAQDATTAEARLHFDRAVSLFESGDHRAALAEFQRAYDLTGRTSVLYNLGATHQALHDYPRAIDALRRYVAATEARTTAERALALRALAQMEPLVAYLRVVRSPADATVLLDGQALEGDRATVGPGPHALVARAPGYQSSQVEVTVVSGDEREVAISLPPVAPSTPSGPTLAVTPPVGGGRRGPDRTLFWSMVITGGALAVGASITGVLAVETHADYATRRVGDPEAAGLARQGRDLSLTADLFAVGAVAAGVTALVLGLTSHDGPPSSSARVFLAPTTGGAAVTAVGRF